MVGLLGCAPATNPEAARSELLRAINEASKPLRSRSGMDCVGGIYQASRARQEIERYRGLAAVSGHSAASDLIAWHMGFRAGVAAADVAASACPGGEL